MLGLVVVDPAVQTSQSTAVDVNERVRGFLRTAGPWGLGVSLLSGVAWLLLEAALMSGQPIAEAIRGGTLWLVLTGTGFGRVWMWRFTIAAALGALMFARAAAVQDRPSSKRTGLRLRSPAATWRRWRWSATRPTDRAPSASSGSPRMPCTCSLPARGWARYRGLPFFSHRHCVRRRSLRSASPLARRADSPSSASRVLARCLLSGLVNAWYLVGDVPALLGTPYGQLLMAKILLFATMVALAATNRRRLTPRVQNRDASALRTLTRNARLEIVLGIAVVAVVGALGVTIPAAHQSPVWPFSFTLSLGPLTIDARSLGSWRMHCHPLHNRARPRVRASAGEARRRCKLAVLCAGWPRQLLVPPGRSGPSPRIRHRMRARRSSTRRWPSPAAVPPMPPTACNAMDCTDVAMVLPQRPCRSGQSTSSNTRRTTAPGIFSGGSPAASRKPP